VVGENDFVNQAGYTAFLSAAAQGFAQGWLGRWIRPDFAAAQGRWDLSRESYSRLLWFTEGVSAYYADLLLLRAKILIPQEYYARTSNEIRTLQEQPGRRLMSLEEASWNVWTRSDNGVDSTISHLLKGKLAGLLLDMEIRGRTQGKRSLDDVVRYLISNYAQKNIGLAPDSLALAIRNAAGIDVEPFLSHVVRSHEELSYNRYLEAAGLEVRSTPSPATLQFGIEFERAEGNLVRVRRVVPGSAAAAARMDAGDILLAIDSERVTFDNITPRIHSRRLGRPVDLTVMRGERMIELSLIPREVQIPTWTLAELLSATPQQNQIRNEWLGNVK
jgi:predicted metalloprotease with PDZ domain